MKFSRCVALSAAVAAVALSVVAGPKRGEMAPDFKLPGSDGATYRLADYHGKQVVVLAWFPKAFTGG